MAFECAQQLTELSVCDTQMEVPTRLAWRQLCDRACEPCERRRRAQHALVLRRDGDDVSGAMTFRGECTTGERRILDCARGGGGGPRGRRAGRDGGEPESSGGGRRLAHHTQCRRDA